ncbi:hypothetical protein BDB00DRAFT_918270 [Zychaea mexicana]|uniref:uncharacterized protein n=1 Tax=Zychaea mexicana TaxID=64656 RepID=UPI0022FECEBB|nr:uncharacterized protein BDB00DRAFT_918270 [Zychaea mexicana]KAI9490114.1 hypothetical protein BDB00DRAFT_918270 [Zychaea mexicana]
MSKAKVNARPITYKKYLQDYPRAETPEASSDVGDKENKDLTEAQLVETLDTLFLIDDPGNDALYNSVSISNSAVIKMLAPHLRDDLRTPKSLGNGVVKMMTVEAKPFNSTDKDSQKERRRSLYMLKTRYHEKVIIEIKDHLSRYQAEIQDMKNAGIEVLGYVRKSPSQGKNDNNRVKLLQQMVSRLQERSRVDKVYVSPCCTSSGPLLVS